MESNSISLGESNRNSCDICYSSHNDKQETNLLQKMLIEKWNQFIHNWWNIVERFVCMYNERAFETFRSNIEFQLCWRSLFNNRCCWTQHSNKTHWQFKLKLFFMSLSGVYAPKKSLLQFESFWQKILFRIQIACFSNCSYKFRYMTHLYYDSSFEQVQWTSFLKIIKRWLKTQNHASYTPI